MTATASTISSTFIWRRVHSLMGFWLVIYLIEHLLVNSQAALWLGDDGIGFIQLVDLIQALPYLQVIETVLIGIPLLIHAIWGIKRALEAKTNSRSSKGEQPALGGYSRNRAFTWQRLSSWILLFGLLGHVFQMRFWERPKRVDQGTQAYCFAKISFDEGLYTLSQRLGFTFYTSEEIEKIVQGENALALSELGKKLQIEQSKREYQEWVATLSSYNPKDNEVIAVAPTEGLAILLDVRNTFKNPIFAALYTIFVLAAAFHAFNGFWTFLITWGVILSYRGQKKMLPVSLGGMLVLSFLGLAAIWGSYWINLRN